MTQPADHQSEPNTYTHHTRPCNIGRSWEYLCQTGNVFTYSHVPFGKIVWHRGAAVCRATDIGRGAA